MTGYRKIGKDHPQWSIKERADKEGWFFCDAVSHNSNVGCNNPACWKNPINRGKTPEELYRLYMEARMPAQQEVAE